MDLLDLYVLFSFSLRRKSLLASIRETPRSANRRRALIKKMKKLVKLGDIINAVSASDAKMSRTDKGPTGVFILSPQMNVQTYTFLRPDCGRLVQYFSNFRSLFLS
jgi:hypothetical protein